MTKMVKLYLVLICVVINTGASNACPTKCDCKKLNSMPSANCEKRSLQEFPSNFSIDTEILILRQNKIKRLPKNFPTLLPNMKSLSIEYNEIEELSDGTFSNLPNLHEVFTSNNKIRSIGTKLFANSSPGRNIKFFLEENLLERVADGIFQGSTSTFIVFWRSNRIKTLTTGVFAGAEGLRHLNIEDNRIETLPAGIFKDLGKMYYLGLGNNRLSSLNSGVFDGLHRVEILTLQKNQLSTLPVDVFKDLSLVQEVNMESNLFTEMPIESIRRLPNFSKVRLANNPIKCTCKLQSDLSDESIKRKISDLNLIRCSNLNKSVEEAIRDVNCVTVSVPTSPIKTTTEPSVKSTTKKGVGEVIEPSTRSTTNSEKDVFTRKNPGKSGYGNQTPLPLIIGVAIGGVIIVVVVILFVYLYRRPIARRAVQTMSLQRMKRKTDPKKDIDYKKSPFNDYSTDYNI